MTGNSPDDGGAPPPIYNGRYELVSQIARGGTAQVYLARDLLLDRPVALKVLFPELSSDSSFVERFRREAQAAANLSHPNIVPVFDWGESERTYFIVMERVDGEPLSAVIRAQAPLPAMRAAAIAGDIAKALSYAHRRGVVHRDVKPGNVLITRDGQVKVADFGIARAVGHDDSVTQTGLVMGTATYFSPEQAQGLGVDGRSDVYSLGVVLYEMVTGRAPFVADTPVAIAYKHVSETPVPPRQIDPRVPAALEGVILRAMAKNPADRYATAEDLHADLERFAQGVAVLAPEVSGGMLTQAMSAAPGSATTVLQSQAGAADATVAIGAGGGGGGAATTGQQAVNGGGPGGLPSKPAMPKRQWIPWTIVGILLIAAIYPLVEYGAHKLGYLGGPGYFHMPALDNHTLASAEGTLKKDGLVADLHAVDSKQTKFLVLGTTPTRGVQVQKGQTVKVTYSGGLAPVLVPTVTNLPEASAETIIVQHGLVYKVVPVTPKLGENDGFVTAQKPLPGTSVQPGITVDLTVPTGVPTVHVPTGLTGKPVGYAETKIRNANLQFAASGQLSATVPMNAVIGTSPTEGSPVPENTTVTILYSLGAGKTVPNVVGMMSGPALAAITTAGLNPVEQTIPSSVAQKGIVITQSPAGLTQEPAGTTVTITVGGGPTSTVTVNEPGNQRSTQNVAIAPLQISATDSAGLSLTYAATLLPNGLSISSGGAITGTPTAIGMFTVTVTATDSAGATGSTVFTWTVKAPK
jgi:beta-lactam-binding protein with PASTA domain